MQNKKMVFEYFVYQGCLFQMFDINFFLDLFIYKLSVLFGV